jgi:hypothetical protein
MNQGGWIHPCAIDCYEMLTTTEQNHYRKEGKIGEKDILMHVIIEQVTVCFISPNHMPHNNFPSLTG